MKQGQSGVILFHSQKAKKNSEKKNWVSVKHSSVSIKGNAGCGKLRALLLCRKFAN